MPDFYNPQPASAPGRFQVTDACAYCAVCVHIAPEFFGGGESEWKIAAYLKRQPVTPEEIDLCSEAKTACPCNAIVDNGCDA